jgi:hypothetical protein
MAQMPFLRRRALAMMSASFWSVAMNRKFWLCGLVLFVGMIFVGMASSAAAQDFGQGAAPCYFCIRDAIYADVKLINHEEANPDIDEGQKGPDIVAARADIHRLRKMLGPLVQSGTEPCCYSRPPLFIR